MTTKQEMADFESRFGNQDNVIRIGYAPSQLLGIGAEYLVVNGQIIAKFFNGNLVGIAISGNTEETVTAA